MSMRLCVPTTVSLPASPPPSSLPFIIPKIVGFFRIIPASIAFLYQLTLIFGSEIPVSPSSVQVQEKCGSFRCGRLQLKLNRFLIWDRAVLIADFAF